MVSNEFRTGLLTFLSIVCLVIVTGRFSVRPAQIDKFVSMEAELYWSLDRLLEQGQLDKAKQSIKANPEVAQRLFINLLFVRLDLALGLEDAVPLSKRMDEVLSLIASIVDEQLKQLMNLVINIKKGSNPFRNETSELGEILAVFVDGAKSTDLNEQSRLWQIAVQKCDELGFELGKSVCAFRLSKSLRDRGELITAFNYFSQTRKLLDQWNYKALLPAVLNGLGVTSYRLGLLETAWQQFSEALDVARKQGNIREQGKSLTNLSAIAIQEGNFRLAAEFLQEAIAHGKTSTRLLNLGTVHTHLRDYESALLVFQEALELAQKAKDMPRQVLAWNNIGGIYWLQGNYEQALHCLQQALEIVKQNEDLFRTASLHLTLGIIYADKGELGLAERHFSKVLIISQQLGDRLGEIGAAIRLGITQIRQNRWDEAVRTLESAHQTATQINHLPSIALALLNLGVAYESMKDHKRALRAYQEALELWRKTGDNWMLAWTWKNIGDAYRKLGNEEIGSREQFWLKAVDAYWRSVKLIEQIRERVGGEAMSAQFAQNASEPFYQLTDILAQMGRTEEALEISERMRARALLELTYLASLLEKEPSFVGEEGKVYSELKRQIAELEGKLLKEMSSPSLNRELVEQLQKELAEVRNEFERRRDILRLQRWQLLPINRGQINFRAWRQLKLSNDTAALVYLVTEQRVLLFVITKLRGNWKVWHFILPVTRKQLEEDIAWLRERIEQRRLVGATLQRLYAILIEPAENALNGKRKLVVVPDGPLYALPFQALQDKDGVHLVERFTIAYTPSLTTFHAVQKNKKLSANENQLPEGFRQVTPVIKNDHRPSMNSPKWWWTGIAVTDFGNNIEPLPHAREEVRWISELLRHIIPKPSIRTLIDENAAKQSTLQALRESQWVHFATHAILEPKRPLYSRLILSAKGNEDNALRGFEILDLGQTPCEKVILSACETGLGKVLRGEGLLGLVWTFMATGTKTLIVSQWRVNDLSTAHLMREYYRYLLNGFKPAEALRQAQMKLISQQQFQHPYFWAAFTVWGSGF